MKTIEPVYEGGFLLWHTLERGYHLAPVTEWSVDGSDFVTRSSVGELRLPACLYHDAGHGPCLAWGPARPRTL